MNKRILFIVLVICSCFELAAQTYPKAKNVIRLLTYNTHYCKGGSDPGSISNYNTERFSLVIGVLDADIVALQELDSAARSRGSRYLLGDIAKATGLDFNTVYSPSMSYDGGNIGCGTLVRKKYAINRIKKVALPGDEPRSMLRVDLDGFTFLSTHFDLNDNKRIQGAGIISNELDYIRKPVFLAGDLNDSHRWGNGGIAMPVLTDKMDIISDTEGNSIPGRPGNNALIDYVLYRDYNNSGIKVINTQIVRTITMNGVTVDLGDISDHYPVFVDIEVPSMTSIGNILSDNIDIYYDSSSKYLFIQSEDTVKEIEIYQITGQKVAHEYQSQSINMTNFPNGVYLAKVIVGQHTITKKILIN